MASVPPEKGQDAVFVTWRVNARPVDDRVVGIDQISASRRARVRALVLVGAGTLVAGIAWVLSPSSITAWASLAVPALGLIALGKALEPSPEESFVSDVGELRRKGGGLVLDTGAQPVALGAEAVAVQEGRVAVRALAIRRYRLPRWLVEQSDLVFPLVMMIVTVLGLQIHLLALLFSMLFPAEGGPVAPEPSIEYLTRLLRGDTAGETTGVVAIREHKVTSETKIESYYLPAGSAGPITEAGGGRRVGRQPRSADPRPQKGENAAMAVQPLGSTEGLEPQDAPHVPDIDDLADPLATPEGAQAEQPESIERKEGFGLTDWYDTEDARKDAEEVRQTIELSDRLLKLDPDNLYGLSIKSYYQYLAMDLEGAQSTYDRMLQLDGTSGATWNNLALVYKRKGEWKKEEELYMTALMMEPDQDNTLINLALCYGHQGRFDEALATMKRVESTIPDDPYADLHRAKIYALMGREEESYRFLRKSLKEMRKLDTLHNIEYQQDVRVDPAFEKMRETPRFKRLLMKYYGKREGGWWVFKGPAGEESE